MQFDFVVKRYILLCVNLNCKRVGTMVINSNKLVVVGMAALLFAIAGCGSNLTDRDGNSYRTVQIGSQTWMAENLKVKTEDSWCYKDEESNCQKYGRLYKWDAAKVACPAGWHLPSRRDFDVLFVAVGSKEVAGKSLKFTSGWDEYRGEYGNGDDISGFSALPAGTKDVKGGYYGDGKQVGFWSSTESNSYSAYYMYLYYNTDGADLGNNDRARGFSVRCLKD
jgi:uncharacterized protein (TIGR02145 family)